MSSPWSLPTPIELDDLDYEGLIAARLDLVEQRAQLIAIRSARNKGQVVEGPGKSFQSQIGAAIAMVESRLSKTRGARVPMPVTTIGTAFLALGQLKDAAVAAHAALGRFLDDDTDDAYEAIVAAHARLAGIFGEEVAT